MKLRFGGTSNGFQTSATHTIPAMLKHLLLPSAAFVLACAPNNQQSSSQSAHGAGHDSATASSMAATIAPDNTSIPPSAENAMARLNASPRHGEWVMIGAGGGDSVRAWVSYPQRSTKAPVVVVIQEIFGLTTWVRSVADQLAADGYIAIAPDLMDGYKMAGAPDSISMQAGMAKVSALNPADVQRRIDATAKYATALPAATGKYGIVGFCWGGMVSFAHAVHSPDVAASVVYYGTSPKPEELKTVKAPVLGLYGGEDARVGATVPPADSAMRAMGKTFRAVTYPGAGHGFLRQQNGMNGANMSASVKAWPETLAWFRQYLGQ